MLSEFQKFIFHKMRFFNIAFAISFSSIIAFSSMAEAGIKRLRAMDIEVNYALEKSDWAGCQKGGYYPIRIQATNKSGKTKRLKFEVLNNSGENSPSVTKQIDLDPNVTAKFSLPVPMVTSTNAYMRFRVLVNGRSANELVDNFSLPEIDFSSHRRPSLLILSPDVLSTDFFELAVSSMISNTHAGRHGGGYSLGENHALIEPNDFLPENWISYSGLDLLAVSSIDFESLTNDQKQAIMKWVRTGGNLIVFNTNKKTLSTSDLEDFFDVSNSTAEWTQPKESNYRKLRVVQFDNSGNIISGGAISPSGSPASKKAKKGEQWSKEKDIFQHREVMLGTITLFKENPFPGTTKDWQWYLESLGSLHTSWQQRHGVNARSTNSGFLKFLIPSVSTVPIISFLVLITVFTALIGPVNYIYFKRRKELVKLLISVPVIAISTSLLLVGYSTIAHGVSIRSRIRSLTVLDQRNNNAVTVSRIALYAGLAPSGGLQFSPDTAVYPIWHESGNFRTGEVDWTNSQHFKSGWLRSRTRTQFATVNHRTERGRVDFNSKDGKFTASNGLEWDLKAILVSDDKGELYYGTNIAAGNGVELSKATKEDLSNLKSLLNESPMELPAGRRNASDFLVSSRSYSGYGYSHHMDNPAKYTDAKTERMMTTWKATLSKQPSKNSNPDTKVFNPNTYIAVFDERPEIDLGKLNPSEEASLHVLKGYF